MKHLIAVVIVIFGLTSLSACGLIDRIRGKHGQSQIDDPRIAPTPTVDQPASLAGVGAQSAAALDRTTEAEKAAATATPAAKSERDLGAVVVALGSPAEQGFWLRSALVTAPAKGRVVTATGQSVNVDLQPGAGAALLSLAAYRALGLGLTDLPELRVFAN